MKRRVDGPLWLSILLGGLAGAIGVASAATQAFQLYLYRSGQGQDYFPLVLTGRGDIAAVFWRYDWPPILLWAVVGSILGSYFGALTLSLIRFINRH